MKLASLPTPIAQFPGFRLCLVLFALGCSRTSNRDGEAGSKPNSAAVAPSTPSSTAAPPSSSELAPQPTGTTRSMPPSRLAHPAASYRLFGEPSEQLRAVHTHPDAASAEVASLAPDATGLRLSGAWQQVERTPWVELVGPGPRGWIDRRILTEMQAYDGCRHARTRQTAAGFVNALRDEKRRDLTRLASPVRGLLFASPKGPAVEIPPYELAQLITSTTSRDWGSGKKGAFKEAVLPKLKKALASPAKQTCGAPPKGSRPFPELENLQSIYFTRVSSGGKQTTVALGVELVAGKPFVAVLSFDGL